MRIEYWGQKSKLVDLRDINYFRKLWQKIKLYELFREVRSDG